MPALSHQPVPGNESKKFTSRAKLALRDPWAWDKQGHPMREQTQGKESHGEEEESQ